MQYHTQMTRQGKADHALNLWHTCRLLCELNFVNSALSFEAILVQSIPVWAKPNQRKLLHHTKPYQEKSDGADMVWQELTKSIQIKPSPNKQYSSNYVPS